MDKNRVRGSLQEMKGAAKQAIGRAVGNRGLVAEGQTERIAGKLRKTLGMVSERLRNVMKKP